MKRLFIWIMMLIPVFLAGEELRLSDAVKRAMDVSHGLNSSKYAVEKLELQKKEAASQY